LIFVNQYREGVSLMNDDLSRRDVAKVLGASLATGSVSPAQEESQPVEIFTNGAMVIWTRGRSMAIPAIMTNCRFERREGRLFVVGVNQPCRANLHEWTNGTTRSIAWDAVDEYVVFDSLGLFYAAQKRQDRIAQRRLQTQKRGRRN
jgi:hypothetical protein